MNFGGISFDHPWLLTLLLAVPVIAWLKGRRGQQAAFLYSSVHLVKGIIGFQRSAAGFILPKLRWLVTVGPRRCTPKRRLAPLLLSTTQLQNSAT